MAGDSTTGNGAEGPGGATPNGTPPGGAQPEGGQQPASNVDDTAGDDHRQARSEAIKWRRLASERDAELTKLRAATQSETDKAIATAKREGFDEATAKYRTLLFAADLRSHAAGVLADPEDAAKLLDLDTITTDDDGRPDAKSVKAAIADLVKAKPYLSAKPIPGNGTGFGGTAEQGVRTNGAPPNDANAWAKGLAHVHTGR